jgi:hypothetical protein
LASHSISGKKISNISSQFKLSAYVGFQILRVVVIKSSIFWDIIPCSQARNQYEGGSVCCLLPAGFLLSLLFNIEDGGDKFC